MLSGILRALTTSGLFLTAIAGQRNILIQFWNYCFALIGKPVPFHTAEDLEVTLTKQGEVYRKQDIQYELVFSDSEENRLRNSSVYKIGGRSRAKQRRAGKLVR